MYKKMQRTKILLVVILFLLAVVMYDKLRVFKDVSLGKIESGILNENSGKEKLTEGDSKSLKRYYGLNEKDFEEVIYYRPTSNMDVDELLIVKVKDKFQIDAVESSVNSRVKSQETTFKDYAPKQYSIVKDNVFDIKGNYVFFAISEDAQAMKEKFINYIE